MLCEACPLSFSRGNLCMFFPGHVSDLEVMCFPGACMSCIFHHISIKKPKMRCREKTRRTWGLGCVGSNELPNHRASR